jgi:hypothetical protein
MNTTHIGILLRPCKAYWLPHFLEQNGESFTKADDFLACLAFELNETNTQKRSSQGSFFLFQFLYQGERLFELDTEILRFFFVVGLLLLPKNNEPTKCIVDLSNGCYFCRANIPVDGKRSLYYLYYFTISSVVVQIRSQRESGSHTTVPTREGHKSWPCALLDHKSVLQKRAKRN